MANIISLLFLISPWEYNVPFVETLYFKIFSRRCIIAAGGIISYARKKVDSCDMYPQANQLFLTMPNKDSLAKSFIILHVPLH